MLFPGGCVRADTSRAAEKELGAADGHRGSRAVRNCPLRTWPGRDVATGCPNQAPSAELGRCAGLSPALPGTLPHASLQAALRTDPQPDQNPSSHDSVWSFFKKNLILAFSKRSSLRPHDGAKRYRTLSSLKTFTSFWCLI